MKAETLAIVLVRTAGVISLVEGVTRGFSWLPTLIETSPRSFPPGFSTVWLSFLASLLAGVVLLAFAAPIARFVAKGHGSA